MIKGKKNKKFKKSRGTPPVKSKDFPLEIKTALSDGRSRKALGLLKEALKSGITIDGKTEEDVYLLRFDDLHSQGHRDEALQFYKQNICVLPSWNEKADSGIQYTINLKLGLTGGWEQYGEDVGKSNFMDQLVLSDVRDPRLFCEHANLPTDHPLKIQAKEILNAWAFIDRDQFPEAAVCLGKIGRRSPFLAWRLFLQALAAYYKGDKPAFEANLSRLPENAAVKPLADRLRGLEQGKKIDAANESPVGNHLAKSDDKSELSMVDQLIKRLRLNDAKIKVNSIHERVIRNGQTLLSCEIGSIIAKHFNPPSSILPQWRNLITLRIALHEPDPEKQRWEVEGALINIKKKKSEPLLDDFDYSILLTKLAEIWFTIIQHNDSDFEDCASSEIWQPRKIRNLSDECPGCVVRIAYNICEQALNYFPLEKTYNLALDIRQSFPERGGVLPLLDSWLKDFPDSMEALERSSRLFTIMGKWDNAEKAITRLENYSGKSLALEDLRFNLAVSRSISLCSPGKNVFDSVSKLFQSVLVPAGWEHVLFESIKWHSCGKDRKVKMEQGKILTSLNAPYKVFHFNNKIKPTFRPSMLPKTLRVQLKTEADAFVSDLETLITLPVLEWSCDDEDVDELVGIADSYGLLDKVQADSDLSYRFLMSHLKIRGVRLELPESAYQITASHLSPEEKNVADFWALRAMYYCYEFIEEDFAPPLPEIVFECLTVAFHYGLTTPLIMDKLMELGVRIEEVKQDGAGLTQKKIQQLTKRESGRVTPRHFEKVIKKWEEHECHGEFNPLGSRDIGIPSLKTVDDLKQVCKELEIPINIEITKPLVTSIGKIIKKFATSGPAGLPPDLILAFTMEMISGAPPTTGAALRIIINYVLQKSGNKVATGTKKGKGKGKIQFSFPF